MNKNKLSDPSISKNFLFHLIFLRNTLDHLLYDLQTLQVLYTYIKLFSLSTLFFVCNNKKEIQHHCKEQRKDYIRNEQNEKKNVVEIQLKKKKTSEREKMQEHKRTKEKKNTKPSAA
jgi:hypothetical protein